MTVDFVRTLTIEEINAMSEEEAASLFAPYDWNNERFLFGYKATAWDIDLSAQPFLDPSKRKVHSCDTWMFSCSMCLSPPPYSGLLSMLMFAEIDGTLYGRLEFLRSLSRARVDAAMNSWPAELGNCLNEGKSNLGPIKDVIRILHDQYPDVWLAFVRDVAVRRLWPKPPELQDSFIRQLDSLVQQLAPGSPQP